MTVDARIPDFEAAKQQLDVLCRKVSLRPASKLPTLKHGVAEPPGTALWSSSYAHLLFWPVDSHALGGIEHCTNEAEGWFEEFLSGVEASIGDRPIDGYLVLALPETPASDARDQIRKLELSSRICRKHFIWPADKDSEEAADAWRRIADVTVLGLPEAAMAGTSELYWPKIDSEAEAVWSDLVQLGAAAAAQRDESA